MSGKPKGLFFKAQHAVGVAFIDAAAKMKISPRKLAELMGLNPNRAYVWKYKNGAPNTDAILIMRDALKGSEADETFKDLCAAIDYSLSLPAKVAAVIRSARTKQGLRQFDLAVKSGVVSTRISLIETGHSKPSAAEAEKLCKALSISEKDLINEEE